MSDWNIESDWRYLKNPDNPDLTSDEPFTCGLYPEHHRLAGQINTDSMFGGCGETKPLSSFTRHILTHPKWRTSGQRWPSHPDYGKIGPEMVICNDCEARNQARFLPLHDALMHHVGENPDGFEQELGQLPTGMIIPDNSLEDPDKDKWREDIENSESMIFEEAWSIAKGKFRGYSRSSISDRDERASKARAWNQSRKNKRKKTRRRYNRNKSRGNVRPKMRRQLGAGGSRAQVAKAVNIPDFSAGADRINFANLYAGLGGFAGAAKQRGHNVQSFDWGMREDGVTDAELKQNDPNYHYDDIMAGSVSQATDRILDRFDGEHIHGLGAGTPCKAFGPGGENVGWKIDEGSMRTLWDLLYPGQDYPVVSRDKRRTFTPEIAAWQRGDKYKPNSIKGYLNSIRGREGGWGMPTFVPRSVDEIMFDSFDEPRIRHGKEVTEEAAKRIQGHTQLGVDMLERTVGIYDDLKRRGKLGFGFIENPMGKMRYMNQISHLPLHRTSAASYREPAHSQLFKLPPEPAEFDMGDFMRITRPNKQISGLPPLKMTDLIGDLPPEMTLRPSLKTMGVAGELYAHGERGSVDESIQGMKGLPRDALFAGSPKVDSYHVRSLAPFQMGKDFIQALESNYGIEAPIPQYRKQINQNRALAELADAARTKTLLDF